MQTVEEEITSHGGKDGWSKLVPRSKSTIRPASLQPPSEARPENEVHNAAVPAQHGPSHSSGQPAPKLKKTMLGAMFQSPLSMIKRMGRSSPVSQAGDVRSNAVRPVEEKKGGSQEDQRETQKSPSFNGSEDALPEVKSPRQSIVSGDSSQMLGSPSMSPRSSVSANKEPAVVPEPSLGSPTGNASTGRRSSFSNAAGSLFGDRASKKAPKEDEVPLADLLKRQQAIRRNSLSQNQGTAPVIPAPT